MNHVITNNGDGSVTLRLGLNHKVDFDIDASPDDVVVGVLALVKTVTGVDAAAMASDVVETFLADEERKVVNKEMVPGG